MENKRAWVEERLKKIEQKREILKSLEEALAKWESDVDWENISAARRAALDLLASESVDTLNTMIANLSKQIKSEITELVVETKLELPGTQNGSNH
jgi:uncharacterized membrane protein